MSLALMAAIASDGAIGKDGGLPWGVLHGDRRWFRLVTRSATPLMLAQRLCEQSLDYDGEFLDRKSINTCIMGRKTWETLPTALPGRQPLVLTQNAGRLVMQKRGRGDFCSSFDSALKVGQQSPHTFIIGGTQVYDAALRLPELETLYITEVDADYDDADTHWPATFVADFPDHTRITKPLRDVHPTAYQRWHRTHVSPWIDEPDRPRYRFGIWERQ